MDWVVVYLVEHMHDSAQGSLFKPSVPTCRGEASKIVKQCCNSFSLSLYISLSSQILSISTLNK